MDHNNNNSAQYESSYDLERVEPGELLEDSWFFGNLLHGKSRMLRSLSDTSTLSSYAQENSPAKSYDETYESIKKLPIETSRANLNRAPSVPLERLDRKAGDPRRSKRSNRKKGSKGLARVPSLPSNLEETESQDEEIEFSMGKLIRQASMNYSDTLPPRTQCNSKGLTNCSTSKHRSRRKPEMESVKIDLEFEELKGFKDLGFDFNQKDLGHNAMNIVPGSQTKTEIEENDGEISSSRRTHRSDAWRAQSYSAPPVSNWGGKRSTEDMKAQIKFWARAVASNVRQEC